MTLLEIPSESFARDVSPSSRPSGWFCARRGSGTLKRSRCWRTIAASPRTRHAFRIRIGSADAEDFIATANLGSETVFLITLRNDAVIGACGFTQVDRQPPEIGYWLGVKHWGKGYATEAVRAVIDHAFTDLDCEAMQSAARVTNPASRRVLEKCGFQWTGAGLLRIRAISSSVPIDRFRLDRGLWASLKSWGAAKRVAWRDARSDAMYQPPHFREDRIEVQHDLIRAHPLGLLITAGPGGLLANSIPFLIYADGSSTARCAVTGARQSAVARACRGRANAWSSFRDRRNTSRPSWYPTKQRDRQGRADLELRHRARLGPPAGDRRCRLAAPPARRPDAV